jgi:large conductance mechanosensitive channel
MILAWVVFLMVKLINRMRRKQEEEAPAATPEDIQLLREIRDELKNVHNHNIVFLKRHFKCRFFMHLMIFNLNLVLAT